MRIEGELKIRLDMTNEQPVCRIQSSRPRRVSQLFVGKSVDDLLKSVPLLFSVCGVAQAHAAVSAVEQLLNQAAETRVQWHRAIAVKLESLREQSWQWALLLTDILPSGHDQNSWVSIQRDLRQLGQALNPHGGLFVRQAQAAAQLAALQPAWQTLRTGLQQRLLGQLAADSWLAAPLADNMNTPATTGSLQLLAWLAQQDWVDAAQTSVPMLPDPLTLRAGLAERLQQEGTAFTAQPDWQGQACEASPFNLICNHPQLVTLFAQHGAGLYTRCYGRLMGMLMLLQELDALFSATEYPDTVQQSPERSERFGLAHIQAARGPLSHYLELEQDGATIRRYYILAPTEWNFHPEGVVAQGLQNLDRRHPRAVQQQAQLFIRLLDPCVAYSLTVVPESG